uniref:alpha-1,2-Mannosidase n=1 Tax=Bursaphelenchus xylophilus TaxID=6326 RepID=A0A1I7SG84_BURXY
MYINAEEAENEILKHKEDLKNQAKEMFMHAYTAYKTQAFMADEIMPISCKPRIRGKTLSRGDVDDSLGNFSLTLVDSLDTLAVLDELDEFEEAAAAIIREVRFDSDFTVSVFETNIRMVGGLISGHLMAKLIQDKHPQRMPWYSDQLLNMAVDLADRLLPAFNSTSGVPYSKINLKRGLSPELKHQSDTCTACAGTIILEFATLSRLTGNPIYEQKSRKAMDFLWNQRNHGSNLMGTVLNVHSGDWIRRDAGIGAGIDSYYEYTLKAYILLGEEDYLHRFNTHYESVMKYLNRGPLFVDVHMHRPTIAARSYMDALLAFWPGVQVLKGDLKGAIEMHEMLYQVIKKHKFLPEAFTHDLQIYWAQHPLRPEFLESTYLLYRATKDPHYLEVAKSVMDSMNQHVRVACGYSAVKDVRSMELLDEMESFVLAETFKYLYMIFAEPTDLLFDPDNYVLTTEAHFLPLTIGESRSPDSLPRRMLIDPDEVIGDDTAKKYQSACPNFASEFRTADELSLYGKGLRTNVKKLLSEVASLGSLAPLLQPSHMDSLNAADVQKKAGDRLRAWAFSTTNADHIAQLKRMGIQIQVLPDGKMQLSHMAQDKSTAPNSGNSWQTLLDYRSVFGVNSFLDLQNDPIFFQSKQALASMSVVLLLILITWISLVLGGAFLMIIAMIMTKLKNLGRKSENFAEKEGEQELLRLFGQGIEENEETAKNLRPKKRKKRKILGENRDHSEE